MSTGNGNSGNGGYVGTFPGLATGLPSDNQLYASENYGSDGVYRQEVEVVMGNGQTQTITQSSHGAPIAPGSSAPTPDNYTPNSIPGSDFGPTKEQIMASLNILKEEASPKKN